MRHSVCRSAVNVARRARDATSPAYRPGEARRIVRDRVASEERPGGHGRDLPVESVVTATERARTSRGLEPQHRAVVELARRPVSLVEIGAALTVPVAVVRGLVGQLDDRGLIHVHVPPAFPGGRPPADVLARLLDGLRAP